MSDNEQKNETRETVSDIVEMLRANARGERFDGFSFSSLADRIEAAWANESKAIATENAVLPAVCITKATDNAAVMRNALEAINCINTGRLKRLLVELVEYDIFDGGLINNTISAVEKARCALSTPEMEMEANNAAAMHEALELVNEIYNLLSKPCIVIEEVRQVCQKARAVLIATPPRNCDVGTAEEQAERQNAYCRKHFTPDQHGGNCRQCPLKDRRGWSCQLAWAQMPYEAEEGGSDGVQSTP